MSDIPEGAIGHKDQMSEEQLAGKVIDGLTGYVFDSMEAYANHTSPVTGFKPTQVEHFGPEFAAVSESALRRGAARKQGEQSPVEQPAEQPPVQPYNVT